jgi:membrane protease subunit (stomatin/prohibitin family)
MADIADVIKYEGDNQTFIWKHPREDFKTGSQLIVHESQEAAFFKDGQALDMFGPGKYTLETQNLPFVSKLFNRVTGDDSPFHCEIYFINKTEQMGIKWGTDSYVEYVEPTYQFPIKIGASGEMSLRAEDSKKLLLKLVGTEAGLTQQGIRQKFRAFLMTRVKTYLAQLIKAQTINIFEIDERLTDISSGLQERLAPDFSDYGLTLTRFFVSTIVKPEDDRSYQKFKELHFRQYADIADARLRQQVGMIDQQTQAQRMVIESQGLAEKRSIEGYTYGEERGFDVAEKVAENEGAGEFSNMGIGLGMVSGVGNTVGGVMGGIVQDAMNPRSNDADGMQVCGACGVKLPKNAKFCMECGAAVALQCKGCGADIPAAAKFCPECGKNLEENKNEG